MQYRLTKPAISVASRIVFCLNLLCAPLVIANPVPADDLSLTNGALSYELYCAQCHGWGPVSDDEDLYDPGDDSE